MSTSLVTTRRMSNVVVRWLAPLPISEKIYICLHNLSSSFHVSFLLFTFYSFFYFVCFFFSHFVQSFLVYSSFSLPYIPWLSINLYIYIYELFFFLWRILPAFYTSVFCLSSSSLFPRACCRESCIQIQPTLPAFMKNLHNGNKLISPTRN